jgi:TP901 family phage tail tape measure protein
MSNKFVGELLAGLGLDTTAFSSSLGKAQAQFKGATTQMQTQMAKVSASMMTAGKTMSKAGKMMSVAFTLSLLAIGAGAYKMQKDFEASLDKVIGLVGVAREQVQAWEKDILNMSVAVGRGPKELADALFFITSAGIKGAEAMEVLEMSAKASASGLGETKVVADLVTSAMNAYGKENLNAATATDILVAAVREGKAEAPDLAAALGQVLPIASAMSVSFDQVGAAVAAMTRTGTSATTASMQLKNIMMAMLKPTQQAEDALQMMGTSSSELRKTLREDGLIAALTDVKELQAEWGEQTIANVFPNIRALSGVLDLMGSNAADNIAIFDALTQTTGSLDRAFESASETAQFKLDQSIAAAQTTLVEFGDALKGPVSDILGNITKKLEKTAKWFGALSDEQKKNIVKWAAIAAGAGPVLLIMGAMASSIGKMINLYGVLLPSIKKVTTAMNLQKVAMAGNPMMAMAAVLATLVAAFIAYKRALKGTAVVQKEVSDSQSEFNELIGEGTAEATKLFNQLEQTNKGSALHRDILGQINEKYGGYLENMLTEKSTLDDIQEARNLVIDGLISEIALKTQSAKINDVLSKSIKTQLDEYSKLESITGIANNVLKSAFKDYEELVKTDFTIGGFTKSMQEIADVSGIDMQTLIMAFSNISASAALANREVNQIEDAYKGFIKNIIAPTTPTTPDGDVPIGEGKVVLSEEEIEAAAEIQRKINQLKAKLGKEGLELAESMERARYERELELAGDNEEYKKLLREEHIENMMELHSEQMDNEFKLIEAQAEKERALKDKQIQEDIKIAENDFLIKTHGFDLWLEYQKSGYTDFYKWLKDKRAKDQADAEEDADKKWKIVQKVFQLSSQALDALATLEEANRQKELTAAGDDEKKKEAINKKYFEKDKKMKIAQALINGALAITNILATVPKADFGVMTAVLIAASVATTAAQVAAISSSSFAEGGMVKGRTLATVGDNPSGKEAIVPFEKMGYFLKMALRNVDLGGVTMGSDIFAPNALKGNTEKQELTILVQGALEGRDIVLASKRTNYRRKRI